jgi:hypothetical protein
MRRKLLGRFTVEGIEWTAFVKEGKLCVRAYGKPRNIRFVEVDKAVELCIASGTDVIGPKKNDKHPEFAFQ